MWSSASWRESGLARVWRESGASLAPAIAISIFNIDTGTTVVWHEVWRASTVECTGCGWLMVVDWIKLRSCSSIQCALLRINLEVVGLMSAKMSIHME